jgi:hypothetical protein
MAVLIVHELYGGDHAIMSVPPLARAETLDDYVDTIITQVQEKYPQAICLMRGETYGDEDLGIDIYVPEEEVLEVSHSVHEMAFNATVGTDWLILPSVAPLESCPVRR